MKNWRWGGNFKKLDKIHIDKRGSDANFNKLRDENQKQMNGNKELNNDDKYVKRKETLVINPPSDKKK